MITANPRGLNRPSYLNEVVSEETAEAKKLPFRPAKQPHWSYDKSEAPAFDPANRPPRTFRRERTPEWIPCPPKVGFPAAKQEKLVAAGSTIDVTKRKLWKKWAPGDGVEGLRVTEDGTKLIPLLVEITLPDGTKKKIQARLKVNSLTLTSYGKHFVFTKCNRGESIHDSRTDKRITKAYAFSELCRILGNEAGEVAYFQLCS